MSLPQTAFCSQSWFFLVIIAQDVGCPNSVLISLSGNGVEPAAPYQRLDFVKAAVAFVPSQNWGPSAGVKWKHCISISQRDGSAQSLHHIPTFLLGAHVWEWHWWMLPPFSSAKKDGNLLMLISLFKWGNFFFFLYEFHLALVCCSVSSALHFQPICSIGTITGAAFPFPLQPLPELYVSPIWSREGAKCISLAGKIVRKLLNQNKQHCHGLVVPRVFTQVYLRFHLPWQLVFTLDVASCLCCAAQGNLTCWIISFLTQRWGSWGSF